MGTIEKLWQFLTESAASFGLKLLGAAAVLLIGLIARKLILKALNKGILMNKLDVSLSKFIKSLVSVLCYIVIFLAIASILGIPTTSFLTILASAGVAVGLALQGSLSNFAGGIMLLLFHPFRVGDYVTVSGATGVVDSINVFYTYILTDDNKRMILPNGSLSNSPITNFSAEGLRRLDMTFSAPADKEMIKVKALIEETAGKIEGVLAEPKAPLALVNKNAGASVEYSLQVWVKHEDYQKVFFQLNEDMKTAFDTKL